VVAECLVGGAADVLRLDPFFPLLTQLGYPAYLATILGTAKILAGLVVAAPRLPRLKEWAYAGILINMLGAAASYLATGGAAADYIPPLTFAALALTSWALRPPERRLPDTPIGHPHRNRPAGLQPSLMTCSPGDRRISAAKAIPRHAAARDAWVNCPGGLTLSSATLDGSVTPSVMSRGSGRSAAARRLPRCIGQAGRS
jgi:hypothetical protein